MLSNLMTPELMQAIEQLQQSFSETDMSKILESLEEYDFNIEDNVQIIINKEKFTVVLDNYVIGIIN